MRARTAVITVIFLVGALQAVSALGLTLTGVLIGVSFNRNPGDNYVF